MKVLGIIPARGGSKGVPGKNTMLIEGKPLIAYAIEVGQKSQLDCLVVNTNDQKIAKVAKEYGCRVVMRPQELASDTANVVDTVLHTLRIFEEQNKLFDAVLLLQPTAPLRKPQDVDSAIKLLKDRKTDGVISMSAVGDIHPARMYRIDNGITECEMPAFETSRRQDLPTRYVRNGCIYLIRTEVIKKEKTLIPQSKTALIMDSRWSVNVDTEIDVVVLKALIKKWKNPEE